MREIKFKALVDSDIIEGRPAETYRVVCLDLDDNGVECASLFSTRTQTFHILKAEHFELIQYIGLRDKTNKEIYENYLVAKHGDIYQVIWDDQSCGFRAKDSTGYKMFLPSLAPEYIEVVGQAYSKPDQKSSL